jgi:hypothetical protein
MLGDMPVVCGRFGDFIIWIVSKDIMLGSSVLTKVHTVLNFNHE